jgi:hypothetical protein
MESHPSPRLLRREALTKRQFDEINRAEARDGADVPHLRATCQKMT